jgi:PAS domain S-box-containing protein
MRSNLSQFQSRQITLITRVTPYAMAGHVVNTTVLAIAVAGSVPLIQLITWCVYSYSIALLLLFRHLKRRGRSPRSFHRATKKATIYAFFLALPWSSLAVLYLGALSHDEELILVALGIGMAASGTVLLSAVPPAALTYMSVILIPSALKCLVLNQKSYFLLGALALSSWGFLAALVAKIGRDLAERQNAELALDERNVQLALVGRAALVGSYAYDTDTERMQVSEGYVAIHGLPEGTVEIPRGRWRAGVLPEDLARLDLLRNQAFRERRREYNPEYRIVRSDGEVRWIESRSFISYGRDGRPQRVVGVNIDVTDRKQTEALLKDSKARLMDALGAGQVMAFEWDATTGISKRCDNTVHILGLQQSQRRDFIDHVHPDDRSSLKMHIRQLRPDNRSYTLLFRFVRQDGRQVWLEETAKGEFDSRGTLLGVKGLTRDVTEQKQLEEHKDVLIAELDHRVKNVLALVLAIASRTQETTSSVVDFVTALDGRLKSMASTHELLSHRRWTGIPLTELVRRELSPYTTSNTLRIEGSDDVLTAEAGQAIAMVLHELATNAAKFGALSTADGQVSVRWRHRHNGHAHKWLSISWEENGGPQVMPQSRSSYGTSVICDLIPYELGGTVDLVYAPEGVRCALEIPVHWLSNNNGESPLSDQSCQHQWGLQLRSVVGASERDPIYAAGRSREILPNPAVLPMGQPVNERAHPIWTPKASDELLRLAVQVGGIGIYETDFEQDRTRFSPELCAILGLRVGTEMTFADASRLFDERDRAAVIASVEAAGRSADEGKWSGVHRIVRPDGAIRWVSIHGRRHYHDTADGRKAVSSVGTVIDITHLKDTEAALRESELRLRLALEAAQMGTFEADFAVSKAFVDAQEAHLLGLPANTRVVSTDELRTRMHFSDLQVHDEKKERLKKHDEAYHHEFRLRMPDGSERWLSTYAAIKSNRIFGVTFDVTERKRVEVALRESEARLRIATSSAALGVFERDVKADRTVWVNDRVFEIFGRTRADGPLTRQQLLQDYVHPDDVDAVKEAMHHAKRKGGSHHVICRIRQKGGSQRWLQIDGKYELTDTGKPSRHIGVISDITERKTLEEEAEELSERLVNLQEDERQRITQRLHDSTAQHLVAANLNLLNLRSKSQWGRDEVTLWDEVEASMAEALKEIRSFSYLMHPLGLDADGLRSTLGRYVEDYANRSGLTVKLRSSPNVDKLPLHMQRSIFRIIQEALANVQLHTSSSQVSVDLRWIGGQLHGIITDNGRGVGEQEVPSFCSGGGIYGIRARTRQLGGDLKIETGAKGTRVHVVAPVVPRRGKSSSKFVEENNLVSAAKAR